MPLPVECSSCPLSAHQPTFHHPLGLGHNGVSIVSASPVQVPKIEGLPFEGRDAVVMARILSKVANRDEFSFRQILHCVQPPGLFIGLTEQGIDHCAFHRDRDVRRFSPKVNVALGDLPLRVLAGSSPGIERARGYRFEGLDGTPVIATYPPDILAKGKMNLIPVVIFDLLTAIKEKGLPPPEYPTDALSLYPSPMEFEEWAHDALDSEFVSVDLETPWLRGLDEEEKLKVLAKHGDATIIRGSMALDEKHSFRAITWPWQEPYTSTFTKLMREPMDKVLHNGWDFDIPKLRNVGIELKGKWQDTMWLFHALQPTLPRGLGAITPYYARVPEWKSKSGADPELYSAMDAWATSKCFVGIRKAMMSRRISA